MFLEGIDSKINPFIKYVKGSLIFVFFHIIGQIPLSLYIISQSDIVEGVHNQQDLFNNLPSNLTLFLVFSEYTCFTRLAGFQGLKVGGGAGAGGWVD